VSRGFKIVIVLFLLAFVGFLIPAAEYSLYLLIGWASFIGNVVPKIEVDWSGVALLFLCLALVAGVGHSFCTWLWHGSGHADPWRPRWTFSGIGVIVLMFAAGMAFTGIAHQTGWLLFGTEPILRNSGVNERSATTSLKTITSAQADFRANDRDWNHVNDYWRGDIAGLYALKSLADPDGPPIKLIELSVAAADDRPKTDIATYAVRSPKAGFWYRALLHADEKEPDPQRFAACSFPANPSAGRWMHIVCENNTIFRKEFHGEAPAVYPKDPVAEGWTKLD
jgi:hypothetical protein